MATPVAAGVAISTVAWSPGLGYRSLKDLEDRKEAGSKRSPFLAQLIQCSTKAAFALIGETKGVHPCVVRRHRALDQAGVVDSARKLRRCALPNAHHLAELADRGLSIIGGLDQK